MALPPAFHESLPYIDPELSPAALAAAHALISAEQSQASPLPPHPQTDRPSLLTPALAAELSRVTSGEPAKPLCLSRYEAQEPPSPGSSSTTSLRPVLENAYISAAYLTSRAQNLILLDRHGANTWLLSNYHLENDLRRVERELADTRRSIDEVNAQRAKRQEAVRAELLMLDETWRRGVGRVLETEVAVEELKAQIREELKRKSAHEAL
ncbi:hypothetical protein HRG_000235 [Hirsutella rhossiliensis]|uniref:Breast carcinoma amplified sequence 2 (BCAS2) domain-containing protein n=1 Tax=Hirsutella rhossiliensis TaxID=111463 RepID=A0A9P8SLL1_9HYPO|nr:breast carcinoma amplified sequence 2 (BCAS2) domain-containing protein [Hirsutella rhossiliensis]KAH0967593.1 breast carcinoma amplified sequence 2 (BCAS2) domain-containing protein [Hirsutella rhossiliensis]